MVKEVKKSKVNSKATKTTKTNGNKKPTKFFRGVWYELKKVNWPTKKELTQHTSVVIGAVAIVTFVVWLMDLGLGSLLEFIIR